MPPRRLKRATPSHPHIVPTLWGVGDDGALSGPGQPEPLYTNGTPISASGWSEDGNQRFTTVHLCGSVVHAI